MPQEVLEARGEYIRLLSVDGAEELTCTRQVPIKAFLRTLADRAVSAAGLQTPLLAPGTRLVSTRGTKTVVVVEQAPQVRPVRWINDTDDGYEIRRLAFPFLVFIFSFDSGELDAYQQLYYRVEPLDRLDAPLRQANLLNVTVASDGPAHWLCLGHQPTAELEWPHRVEAALENFWSATFNRDFEVPRGSGFTRLAGLDPRICSVEAWEAASRVDPLFPLKIDWPAAEVTLGQAIIESMAWNSPPMFPDNLAGLADTLYRVPVE